MKYLVEVIDGENEQFDTLDEAREYLQEEVMDMADEGIALGDIGYIYELIETHTFDPDEVYTKEYLEDCKQEGEVPEYAGYGKFNIIKEKKMKEINI